MDRRDTVIVEGLEAAGAVFRHCPSCGSIALEAHAGRHWTCPDCGFQYFHNVAAAAGIVIEREGRILFLVRAKEPAKGKLALPGGFIDAGERAEDAAIRECREEAGWPPVDADTAGAAAAEVYRDRLRFIGSFPNLYWFRGMPYATCDLFFSLRIEPEESGVLAPGALAPGDGEAESLVWHPRRAIPFGELAFGSAEKALKAYLGKPG